MFSVRSKKIQGENLQGTFLGRSKPLNSPRISETARQLLGETGVVLYERMNRGSLIFSSILYKTTKRCNFCISFNEKASSETIFGFAVCYISPKSSPPMVLVIKLAVSEEG